MVLDSLSPVIIFPISSKSDRIHFRSTVPLIKPEIILLISSNSDRNNLCISVVISSLEMQISKIGTHS